MTKDHTNRIISRMIQLIDDYRNNNINLNQLVNSLEGSLTALEERPSEDFLKDWYAHWGALEQWVALQLEDQRQSQILEELKFLEVLLSSYLLPKV